MSRLSIRARLTGAFALAMIVVLAGAGLFVYLRFSADLDEAVNTSLAGRADAAAALVSSSGQTLAGPAPGPLEDPEESFVQVLSADARVLDATGRVADPVLGPREVREATREGLLVERSVPGIEGTTRVLARPLSAAPGSAVLVVGQSLDDRSEALAGLVASLAIGGPVAVALASIVGYLLAAAGLAPVEAMRRRAREVSLARDDEWLPLPAARDEVRRLAETLNEMLDRLRRSFARERRFVADASHELRTPVAVLKTELEGALRTGDFGPEVREALVAAVEECDHLAALAEDLLVVARAAEGELPVSAQTLEARALLEAVSLRFSDRARERGRPIRVDAPPDLSVHADPDRMRQALGNLVDNALRHGEGEIVLSAGPGTDGGVELEVADEGSGFGPEIVGNAFERFTRGDVGRTRGGSGLGMAIVRAIAEAHHGCAEVVAGPGGRVRLSLPRDPAQGSADH